MDDLGQQSRHLSISRRILILLMVFIALSTIFGYASTLTLSPQQAESLAKQVASVHISTTSIFFNNLEIALIEFIPVVGAIFGAYSSYATGLTTAAIAQTSSFGQQTRLSGFDLFLFLLVTPIYWMEFFCYSLAVEESFSIIISIKHGDFFTREWKWLLGSILTVVVVLLVSARLEVLMIQYFG